VRVLCASLLTFLVLTFTGAGAAQAACTVSGGTLTVSAANSTYGPSTAVAVTFTVSYTVNSTTPGQCGNRTITITPTASGGTWSAVSCSATVTIPNNTNGGCPELC